MILNEQFLNRGYKTIYLPLNWRDHVSQISKIIKRNIGAISKIRHFVNLDIFKSVITLNIMQSFVDVELIV